MIVISAARKATNAQGDLIRGGGGILGGFGRRGSFSNNMACAERAEAIGSDVDSTGLDELCRSQHCSFFVQLSVIITYRTAQIINKILRIFNTNTQPNDIFRHVPLPSRLLIDTSMAHAARHAD